MPALNPVELKPRPRLPEWLRIKLPTSDTFSHPRALLDELKCFAEPLPILGVPVEERGRRPHLSRHASRRRPQPFGDDDEVSCPAPWSEHSVVAVPEPRTDLVPLDFRFVELDWRTRCPKAAKWFESFGARRSMQQTIPHEEK